MRRRSERNGEFHRIARIRDLLPDGSPPGVVLGPGDDCAACTTSPGKVMLATVDALVEDRHFTRRSITPAALGLRLAAVNLSDVAAMGGVPRWGLLSLALPDELSASWTERIAAGVIEGLGRHEASLVGGNLSASASGIVADLVVLGEVEPERMLRRTGARPGDCVAVTGRLGAAAAGRALGEGIATIAAERQHELLAAHRRPRPRIREGRALSASGRVHAAIDLSDGLLGDATHVARASHVDVVVHADALPIPDAVRAVAGVAGTDPLRWALSGGEDYELLFTCAPGDVASIERAVRQETGTAITVIGETMPVEGDEPVVRVVASDGTLIETDDTGWDHFRSDMT